MSWAEIEIDASGKVTVRRGGTLTGEPEPEPESKPRPITWRLCVKIHPGDSLDREQNQMAWYPSEDIPLHWYPIERCTKPVETVKRFAEGEES